MLKMAVACRNINTEFDSLRITKLGIDLFQHYRPMAHKTSSSKSRVRSALYEWDVIYPNSPLLEVVCQIRFPGEIGISCRIDEFYSRIREVYPRLRVPKASHGEALSLQPYHFTSEDETDGVLVALNSFALTTKNYKGHAHFSSEFTRVAKIFNQKFSLKRLNRFGLRYVNFIPYQRENGTVPVNRFLQANIQFPKPATNRIENLALALATKLPNATLTVRIESMIDAEKQQEALLLDFDYGKTVELTIDDLEKYYEEARKQIRKLFENLITPTYREYLKGKGV